MFQRIPCCRITPLVSALIESNEHTQEYKDFPFLIQNLVTFYHTGRFVQEDTRKLLLAYACCAWIQMSNLSDMVGGYNETCVKSLLWDTFTKADAEKRRCHTAYVVCGSKAMYVD